MDYEPDNKDVNIVMSADVGTTDIEERVTRLENTIINSRKEFYDDFKTYDYINTICTSAVKTQGGYTTKDVSSSSFVIADKYNDFKKDVINTTSDIYVDSDGYLTCTSNVSRYESQKLDIENVNALNINCDSIDASEIGVSSTITPTLSPTLTKQFIQFIDNRGGKWTVWYRLVAQNSTEVNYKREYIDSNGIPQTLSGSKTIAITAPSSAQGSTSYGSVTIQQVPVGNISFQIHEEDLVSISYSIGSCSQMAIYTSSGASYWLKSILTLNYVSIVLDNNLNIKFSNCKTDSRTIITNGTSGMGSTVYLKMIPRGNAKVVILNNAYVQVCPGYTYAMWNVVGVGFTTNTLADKAGSIMVYTYAYNLAEVLTASYSTEAAVGNNITLYKNFDVIKTASEKFIIYAQYDDTLIKRFEFSSIKNDDYTRVNTITSLSSLSSTINPSDNQDITSILTSKQISTTWYPRVKNYDGLANMFIKDNILYIISINITTKRLCIAKYTIQSDGVTISFNPNTDIASFSINNNIGYCDESPTQNTTVIQQYEVLNYSSNIIIKNDTIHIAYIGINKLTTNLQHIYYKTVSTDLSSASNDYIINNSNTTTGIVYSGINLCLDNSNILTINRNMYNAATPTFAIDTISVTNSSIQYQYKLSSNINQWVDFNKSINLNNLNESFIIIGANFNANTINNNYSKISKIELLKIIDEDLIINNYLHLRKVPLVASSGAATLNSNCNKNNGTIDWQISYNDGISWIDVNLGEEFMYSFNFTPNVNIRAKLQNQINEISKPIINDVSLTSTTVAIHTLNDENVINTMKTNIKIDKAINSTANKMLNMYIDTFNDQLGVDIQASDFVYDSLNKNVSGNFIESRAITTNTSLSSIILTVNENLNTNGRIEYFASTDDGISYTLIERLDSRIAVIENKTGTLKLKAVFYNNAKLNAWGCSWC